MASLFSPFRTTYRYMVSVTVVMREEEVRNSGEGLVVKHEWPAATVTNAGGNDDDDDDGSRRSNITGIENHSH